ncbi:hypothetical protein NP233_g3683 [Leucocoprinus birnbaumii]|uniref:Uncharacterized protein n=1 Tax=Leucocoprinus birnbaumii TaxID=56174 RepID=A0AAD5W2N9_9AGAR|nr:hypothetical protein NP233_g3683 [Leucocoprinus birnbaumii]
MGERADLVKKARKLTRVFGETPGGGDLLSQTDPLSRAKQQPSPRTALALDVGQIEHVHSSVNRRHSIPPSPDQLSESFNHALFQTPAYKKARMSVRTPEHEEEVDEASLSPISFAPNSVNIASHYPPSPSQLSLYEAMTPEQRAEEEKRRKREKLAKLHRFLGSRVPADLVLGVGHPESSLPPIQITMPADDASPARKEWLRRRRSSSAGDLPNWSDDLDRMKEELNDQEKAINVRRAQKMEKMFGVAPPQTLYHTRHSPSPSVPPEVYLKRSKSPPKPSFGGFIPPGEVPSPTFQQRNPNRSSYIKRPKKTDRPGTAESSTRLLPEGADCYNYDESPVHSHSGGGRTSLVYNHYQHSLKSLGDILDRDDRESLAELHQYLNNFDETNNPASPPLSPLCETPKMKDRRLSNASSIKSERRRSLPARTSMLSITSEYSITTPKPEISDFQVRRRRAAKLTQFFGVNYRELINDVLESLETGLEHERKRGTLRAEELDDLLERLRKIKMNRKGFF